VDLFFARIFGMGNKLITARAVARAELTDIKSDCVKPFAIPYPWNDNTPGVSPPPATTGPDKGQLNGLYDPGEEVYTGAPGLVPGTPMTIKFGVPSTDNGSASGQQTSGQFFVIQGNVPNPGQDWSDVMHWQADEYRDYINGNKCFNVSLQNPVDLMTGGREGSTIQEVKALMNDPTGACWDTTTNAPTNMSSTRVIRILMYDQRYPISGGGGQSGGSGTGAEIPSNHYTIAGFWLQQVCGPSDAGKTLTDSCGGVQTECPRSSDKGSVIGKYIGNMGSGSSTGTTPENPTGTEVKKIALVE